MCCYTHFGYKITQWLDFAPLSLRIGMICFPPPPSSSSVSLALSHSCSDVSFPLFPRAPMPRPFWGDFSRDSMQVAAYGPQLWGDPRRGVPCSSVERLHGAPSRCRSSLEEAGNEWMAVTGDSPSACQAYQACPGLQHLASRPAVARMHGSAFCCKLEDRSGVFLSFMSMTYEPKRTLR